MAPWPGRTGAAGPEGAKLTPQQSFTEPHRAPAAANTQGRGKGENKNRKDGRETKTKTQKGTILWKSMKWDSRKSV